MLESLLEKAVFEVKIKSPSVAISEKNLGYAEAKALVAKVTAEQADDAELQQGLANAVRSFGFSGWGHMERSVMISASLPRIATGEKLRCSSRAAGGPVHYDNATELPDEWIQIGADKCCSYCGSVQPERLLELVLAHGWGVVEFTSKGYKWYLRQADVPNGSFGAVKYYRWHDTSAFLAGLQELMELKTQTVAVMPTLNVTIN